MKKNAFTLAEGATHTNMLQRVGNGFTLAEILITLAIIGVVAAMTIPTLIAKINSIVTDNQQKVFNAKLIKGLNLTKTAGDLNNTYTSTYDFLVNGLGKNLKMAKVCDSDHIRDCIPYDKIKYNKNDDAEDTVNVANLKTANKIKLDAPFTDTAAFVLADGTPVIVSYNLKCIDDPDKADTTINACLAGVYDLNGTRKPNKYAATLDTDGKTVKAYTGDLRGFNGASIGSSCAGKIGNVCLASTAVTANDAMLPLIQAVDPSYTMPKFTARNGNEYNNYRQLAIDYCNIVQNGTHLPNKNELLSIAKILYNDNTITSNGKSYLTMTNKSEVYATLGIESTASWFSLWSSEPYDSTSGRGHVYNIDNTEYMARPLKEDFDRAICVSD